MPVGGAILGAGALGAGGSIISGLIGSSAAKSASAASANALTQALGLQKSMFDTATGYLAPFANAGASVLPTLKSLLTPGANMTDTLSQIPGFQFAQNWGQKAVQNLGTVAGLGGNTLRAGVNFATGTAQNTFGQIVNALQTLVNSGTGAASSLAGAATTTGATAGNTLGQIGGAQASGILGSANALSSIFSGAGGAAGNALLLNALLKNNGGGIYSSLSGPAYGGGNFLTDAYGGSPDAPLPGLSAADYG